MKQQEGNQCKRFNSASNNFIGSNVRKKGTLFDNDS